MSNQLAAIDFCLSLAKFQNELSRRLDAGLNGIALNEFIVMYHLQAATDHKLRRTDLAAKVGLTASGITRMLLPMEKIGLVSREADERDARVSFVVLAPGGQTKFEEALERLEIFLENLIPEPQQKQLKDVSEFLNTLAKNI